MRRRLLLVLALAACGRGGGGGPGGDPLEQRLAADVGRALGVRVERVRCAPGPAPVTCTVAVVGDSTVEVALTDDGADTAWELRGHVIGTAPLVAEIADALAELGVVAQVDCGAPLQAVSVGARLACTLDVAGVRGAAWATILDDEGGYRLEVALDPAAAAARSGDADDEALRRASVALDRDDAERQDGVDDPDDDGAGADADAGVADAGAGTGS